MSMAIRSIANNAGRFVHRNSPTILSAIGASGVITTAFLTGKASFKAADILASEPEDLSTKERALIVWKLYIPAAMSGGASVACIIASTKVGAKRAAAMTAAYSLSERAFSEYREKIVEEIGEGKELKIRDALVANKVKDNPPRESEVIVTGSGDVLCCELHTGRYFRSDMETLRKAENHINSTLIKRDWVYLDDLYEFIGIPTTSNSGHMGWEVDRLLELEFTSVLSEEGKPCLAFDYNYIKPI